MLFIADSGERVTINGMSAALRNSFQPSCSQLTCGVNGVMSMKSHKKRVAVLISGSGLLCCLSLYTVSYQQLPVLFLG